MALQLHAIWQPCLKLMWKVGEQFVFEVFAAHHGSVLGEEVVDQVADWAVSIANPQPAHQNPLKVILERPLKLGVVSRRSVECHPLSASEISLPFSK